MVDKVDRSGKPHKTYGFKKWMDNLYVTFGTKNIFKILLPSIRPQPLTGLEWTAKQLSGDRKLHDDLHKMVHSRVDEDTEIKDLEINL